MKLKILKKKKQNSFHVFKIRYYELSLVNTSSIAPTSEFEPRVIFRARNV